MTSTDYQRYFARVNRYGFTPEEAFHCPPNTPLWMYRLEQEEGITFAEFVKRELPRVKSFANLARSIGENKDKVYYWIRKLRKMGEL